MKKAVEPRNGAKKAKPGKSPISRMASQSLSDLTKSDNRLVDAVAAAERSANKLTQTSRLRMDHDKSLARANRVTERLENPLIEAARQLTDRLDQANSLTRMNNAAGQLTFPVDDSSKRIAEFFERENSLARAADVAARLENPIIESARRLTDRLDREDSLSHAIDSASKRMTDFLERENSLARAIETAELMSNQFRPLAAQIVRDTIEKKTAAAESNSFSAAATNLISVHSSNDVGILVKAARKSMKLNQQQFADLTSVGRRFISELESGKPTLEFDRVVKVCNACGIGLFVRLTADAR